MAFLGSDPGQEVDDTWWDEMLVAWFDVPEAENPAESGSESDADSDHAASTKTKESQKA